MSQYVPVWKIGIKDIASDENHILFTLLLQMLDMIFKKEVMWAWKFNLQE
jgi:hypothetical protein